VVKSTDCSSRGPEFNSQQPHGGSQPSVMGSDALFWCLSEDRYGVLLYKINKSLKKKQKNQNNNNKKIPIHLLGINLSLLQTWALPFYRHCEG